MRSKVLMRRKTSANPSTNSLQAISASGFAAPECTCPVTSHPRKDGEPRVPLPLEQSRLCQGELVSRQDAFGPKLEQLLDFVSHRTLRARSVADHLHSRLCLRHLLSKHSDELFGAVDLHPCHLEGQPGASDGHLSSGDVPVELHIVDQCEWDANEIVATYPLGEHSTALIAHEKDVAMGERGAKVTISSSIPMRFLYRILIFEL
jgi:hypothetical protein